MDALLNQRWQVGLAPFDGNCLITAGGVSVEELLAILASIIPELKRRFGNQSLYTFDDWHQHDGYITQRRQTSWDALAAVAQDRDALMASRQGDAYVQSSFYPEDTSFLLRYGISDEWDDRKTELSGTFDLSAQADTIAQMLEIVPLQSRLCTVPAKGYFDRTYSG